MVGCRVPTPNRHVLLHSLSANHAIDVAYVIGIPCALNAECVSLSYVFSHTLHHNASILWHALYCELFEYYLCMPSILYAYCTYLALMAVYSEWQYVVAWFNVS